VTDKPSRFPLLALLLLCSLWLRVAEAGLTIEITQGVQGAMPIAIVPFGWEAGGAPIEDMAAVISADLARSGRFKTLPPEDMLERPTEGGAIGFQNWRILGMDNLVVGRIRPNGGGYEVQFQLYDVFRGNQLIGMNIPGGPADLRGMAHHIADLIYEKLTGERGAFNTRIAYVTATREKNPNYTLIVADADGYAPQTILRSKQPLMSPSWSPDGRRLAYVSFEKSRSEIYIQDIATGSRERIAAYDGINGAPAWSPDGRRLALTLSQAGSPDIYVLDIASRQLSRLTNHPAIDTEPNWTPDGRAVVFTSDRGGKPQIYRVPAQGGNAERVTFDGDYNARAGYSPDGKGIAMVHRGNRGFTIGLYDTATRRVQVLTDGPQDESPSFAPNGSMILYATRDGGRGVLAAVSVDGRVRQLLVLQEGDVREPAWSPFLR
jgi:TolB protein